MSKDPEVRTKPWREEAFAFDLDQEAERISGFIERQVSESGCKGVVVGLSGGVDSAVVGRLCVKALSRDRVVTMLMPSKHTPSKDLQDASDLAADWGTEKIIVHISPIVDSIVDQFEGLRGKIPKANVQARVRMILLYYVANARGLLVAGTGDRSEEEIGFFSKWGDGGVDFLPIAHLFKTQVRSLGRFLGIPKGIVTKPASPQLWRGHTAIGELGIDYDRLDMILHLLLDERLTAAETASRAGVKVQAVRKVIEMHESSAHKRKLPPSLNVR